MNQSTTQNESNTAGRGRLDSVSHTLRRVSPGRVVAVGFALLILIGSGLLMLPIASTDGEWTGFLPALFTSTSATCVTGLTMVDTYGHWSLFGQIVIICLIQIGGLGFITIVSAILLLARRQISLKQRDFIRESLNSEELSGLLRLLRKVIHGTLLVEGIGALILTIRFYTTLHAEGMTIWEAVYFGIFHSISAFCNAGFDLLGKYGMSSFTSYSDDPVMMITICLLILIGGLGFVVWDDLFLTRKDLTRRAMTHRQLHFRGGRFRKSYRLQTKIVMCMTLVLVAGGTVLFLALEWGHTFADMGLGQKIWSALFCAVTPRTAGFNVIDYAEMSEGGKLLTILLMFIGGGSGSTAGGVKMTTVFVLLIHLRHTISRDGGAEVFGRRIDETICARATAVMTLYLILIAGATLIISGLQDVNLGDATFEVVSALCTVGVTAGLTRKLCAASQVILIALMYIGRLGSLSFALVFTDHVRTPRVTLPRENINVG